MSATSPSTKEYLASVFPEREYYTQEIGFASVFGNTRFSGIIESLVGTSELADCLYFLPDALVVSRSLPPEEGSFLVRFFDGEIKLGEQEAAVSGRYSESLLLYAPKAPKYIWFSDYAAGKAPIDELFTCP